MGSFSNSLSADCGMEAQVSSLKWENTLFQKPRNQGHAPPNMVHRALHMTTPETKTTMRLDIFFSDNRVGTICHQV